MGVRAAGGVVWEGLTPVTPTPWGEGVRFPRRGPVTPFLLCLQFALPPPRPQDAGVTPPGKSQGKRQRLET